MQLKVSIDDQEELSFYHSWWFGNYLDYQEDRSNKSALIWFLIKNDFKKMHLDVDIYKRPEELVGKSFYALIGSDSYGICLSAILEGDNEV